MEERGFWLQKKMIIERKEYHCQLCGGIKILKKSESPPYICPFCGNSERISRFFGGKRK